MLCHLPEALLQFDYTFWSEVGLELVKEAHTRNSRLYRGCLSPPPARPANGGESGGCETATGAAAAADAAACAGGGAAMSSEYACIGTRTSVGAAARGQAHRGAARASSADAARAAARAATAEARAARKRAGRGGAAIAAKTDTAQAAVAGVMALPICFPAAGTAERPQKWQPQRT